MKALPKLIDTLFAAGIARRELVDKKGIVVRFVIGRRYIFGGSNSIFANDWVLTFWCSANDGDSLDKDIKAESSHTNDFVILVCYLSWW